MIRKFRLAQKDRYERIIIARNAADMLETFIEGRSGPLEMGSEQGGISEWDDFVIRHPGDLVEHIQIKRQTGDFCTKSPRTKPADDKALSVIDKAMKSLADWTRVEHTEKKSFALLLPAGNPLLKKDLSVSHFEEVCRRCKADGVSAGALANRNDGPTTRVHEWLTNWCGFDSWEHIVAALKILTVKFVLLDDSLEDETLKVLARHFSDPERSLAALLAYIGDESSDVSSLSCRSILKHLQNGLRAEVCEWTQYRLDNTSDPWTVSGTNDVKGQEPERAAAVVRNIWSSDGRDRKLRVSSKYQSTPASTVSLTSAILRMALHLQGSSQGLLTDHSTWRAGAASELGQTLGVTDSDFEFLPWSENHAPLEASVYRELVGLIAERHEAAQLHEAMDDEVWTLLSNRVSHRLQNVNDQNLAGAMDAVWLDWKKNLSSDREARLRLLNGMLYPATEGRSENHRLRCGPKMIDVLSIAVETLLVLAVAIGGPSADWRTLDGRPAQTIALRRWSGPYGQAGGVRELGADSLTALVGTTPPDIVLLPGVDTPASEMLNVAMADDPTSIDSFATAKAPRLLVTRSQISRLLRSGTLASVCEHFRNQWEPRMESRKEGIAGMSGDS